MSSPKLSPSAGLKLVRSESLKSIAYAMSLYYYLSMALNIPQASDDT